MGSPEGQRGGPSRLLAGPTRSKAPEETTFHPGPETDRLSVKLKPTAGQTQPLKNNSNSRAQVLPQRFLLLRTSRMPGGGVYVSAASGPTLCA